MNILAFDTSTEACSAAISVSGEISERFEIAAREHSKLILPMLDTLLAEAGLTLSQMDAIAFGCGPGSFTGVRIAAGIAQGVAFGADLPVVPVSSLAALAQGAYRDTTATHVLAALDARMGEVYWGAYEYDHHGIMILSGDEGVYPPDQAPIPAEHKWFGTGSGWAAYGAILQTRLTGLLTTCETHRYPHARDIAVLGAEKFKQGSSVKADDAVPVYLRNEVAWKKVK